MLRSALAMAFALSAGAAEAADKLAFGPPPNWVKPIPAATTAAASTDDAALRVLRFEMQLRFGPEGDSTYFERQAQVRKPFALGAMGTFVVNWDPKNETVTVHKVRLVRDGRDIDVLAKQSFEIIRRETQLREIVDGRLTASLQPEDLRVGDILEVAYTVTRLDPVMQGRTDALLNVPMATGVETVGVRATWPDSEAITWRAGGALPQPRVRRAGGISELTLELKNPKTPELPLNAPRRYWPSTEIEFSEFPQWADVAALMAPLYQAASALPADSPLKAEAAKIAAQSSDPKARAAAALKLVQDEVRYLGRVLTDGGYTPVHADTTWQRRYGECKAKTVLLIALLKELGIRAEPALVNAFGSPMLDKQLPRVGAFNHVIVRAEIDGKVFWLDGTRTGDGDLDALEVPPHDWALPIRPEGSELVALVRAPRTKPDSEVALDIDASAGIDAPAPVKGVMIMRGDMGLWPSLMVQTMPAAEREKLLKAMWSRYPWIEVKSARATRDPKTGESRMSMEGVAKLTWLPTPAGVRGFYIFDAFLGFRADFKREPGPLAEIPFSVNYPSWTAYSLTMKLPYEGDGFSMPPVDVDKTVAGRAFLRKAKIEKGVLRLETSTRSLAPEFPASEAKAAAAALTELANVRVYLQEPFRYRATPADVAAWLAKEPKTAREFVERGLRLQNVGRTKEALADYDKAIALDPKESYAYANRGFIHLSRRDRAAAKADLDKAVELEPRNAVVQNALGQMALEDARWSDAVAHFTRAADLQVNNTYALGRRAFAHSELGDTDKAIADLLEVSRIDPTDWFAHAARGRVHLYRREAPKAAEAAEAILAAAPKDPEALTARGDLLARMGRRDDAERAFATALAIKPIAATYFARATFRDPKDLAGRLADLAAANALSRDAYLHERWQTQFMLEAGAPARALPILNGILRDRPDDIDALARRATAYHRMGRTPEALRDLATMRNYARGIASSLNQLCWTQATLGVTLETALADCEAALKLDPRFAPAMDSRGLVLLRLGRAKEALASYDAALALRKSQPASLYGRGLAKLELGLAQEAEPDMAAARAISIFIDREFAAYGVTPATARAQAAVGPAGR